MGQQIRSIIFIVPAQISAAVEASEMSFDFLSKVDWLADALHSLRTDIRQAILHTMRCSVEAGRSHVAIHIDVFQQNCIIRVSQHEAIAKPVIFQLTPAQGKSKLSEGASVEASVS